MEVVVVEVFCFDGLIDLLIGLFKCPALNGA